KYSADSTPVLIRAAVDDGLATLSVRDSGIGVEPDQQDRIFERFVQADQSTTRLYGGVGLGLHLVRELTGRLGGHVDVDSRPGVGSTFTVTLPLRLPQGVGGSTASGEAPKPQPAQEQAAPEAPPGSTPVPSTPTRSTPAPPTPA